MSLEDAEQAEDPAQRLALLLEVWRAKRSAEVRELVLAASARAQPALPPQTRRILAKEWDELEARGLPADLPRLLDSIRFENPTEGLRRFRKLLERPEDPRIGEEIVGWFASPPCARRTPASVHFWDVVVTRIPMNDPALGPKFAEAKTGGSSSAQRSWLANAARRFGKTLRAVAPPLTPEEAAVVARLRALLAGEAQAAGKKAAEGARSEQELLDAIYAAPDDDGPRLVYADWLQERGDPWGELIVLQLAKRDGKPAKASSARMKELIEKHGQARLRGLPVDWKTVVFARGFAVEAMVFASTQMDRRNGDSRWATFEELRFPYWEREVSLDMLADPAKKALRRIQVHAEIAESIAKRSTPLPFPLETLSFYLANTGLSQVLDAIASSRSLDKLRTLRVENAPDSTWKELLGHSIERKLSRLETAHYRNPWRVARERLDGGGTRLELVILGRIAERDRPILEKSLKDAASGITESTVTSPKPMSKKTAGEWREFVKRAVGV